MARLEGFLVQKAQQPGQAQFITVKYCKVYINLSIRRSRDLSLIGDIVKVMVISFRNVRVTWCGLH